MMREISLHILDIIENSIGARANKIKVTIEENTEEDYLKIKVIDNGCGMDKEEVRMSTNPFYTKREIRRVGLGISLFKSSAENCNGYFKINSKKSFGTKVEVAYQYSHIDRQPLGDIGSTLITAILGNEDLYLHYEHIKNDKFFVFDTDEVKKELDGVPLNNPEVVCWIREYIKTGIEDLV